MRKRDITISSSELTKHQNAAGYKTKLLSIRTPEGTKYLFQNPSVILLKLYDNLGNEIPYESRLFIAKQRPGEDFETYVSKFEYASYHGLDITQQQNAEYIQNVTQFLGALDVNGIRNDERHELQLYIETGVAVNLNDARTRFVVSAFEQN